MLGVDNMKWKVVIQESRIYRIQSVGSGQCISITVLRSHYAYAILNTFDMQWFPENFCLPHSNININTDNTCIYICTVGITNIVNLYPICKAYIYIKIDIHIYIQPRMFQNLFFPFPQIFSYIFWRHHSCPWQNKHNNNLGRCEFVINQGCVHDLTGSS